MIQSTLSNKPVSYPRQSRFSSKQYILDITGKSFSPEELNKNQDYFPNNDKPFNYAISGQSAFPALTNSNEDEQTTPVSTTASSANTSNYAIYQKSFSQQSMTNTSTSAASRKVDKGPANTASSTAASTAASTAHTEPQTSLSNQSNSGDNCCSNSNHGDDAGAEAEGAGRDRNRINIYGHFKAYKCFHCSKSFNRRTYLKSHERVHSGEKPFTCIYCQKSFAQRTNLRSHERTHTGEKPYVCLVCQRSFCQLNELRSHERVHTGARPYQCPYCPKAFTQLTNLRNHIRTHTGEKPYVCMICTRSFAQHNELKSHERIHTGEKPYTCSLCSKAFSQRTNLRNHERVHSGEKPYQCTYCSKAFSQRGTLKNHELTHTLDKSTSRKSQKAVLAAHSGTQDSETTGIKGSEKPNQHSTEHDPELILAASAAEEGCSDEHQDEAPSQLPATKYHSSSKWASSTGSIQRGHNSSTTTSTTASSASSSTSSSMNLLRTAHTNNLERSCMRQDLQQDHQSSTVRFQQMPTIPSMLVTPPYLHQMTPGWENSYTWSRGFSMASGWPSGGKNLPSVHSHEGKLRKHRGIAEKGKNTNSFDIRKEIHSNTK